ncbi:hypothetical protein DOK78_002384 [Enterococcus sp. DIV2402]|uniref:Replication initiator A N-terminal domain-containing protein n=1 Tax=Candidatus Enterococcus lowellii TaxID=2230877 RepID=A0ABZ2SPN6_9ENTE|nr:replication initiator protein A [Enterococcus sp. DIV2402]MBO0463496.1 replication initiator protein A [Enterococcus sp. DIV2402]
MSNRRYTLQNSINMKFYQLPKVFFTNKTYKRLSNNAKIMYVLLSDRLALSIQNKWLNETGEVYFVFPITKLCELTDLSNKTVIKVKKELIDAGLLEEEQTGRANKMFLLQPQVEESDVYHIQKMETDLDFGAEILDKDGDGKTRSVNSSPQGNSRNEESTLQVETPLNKQFDQKCKKVISSENQKCKNYTTEVKKLHPNDIELKETEDEDNNNININAHVRESLDVQKIETITEPVQSPMSKILTDTGLFDNADIQIITNEFDGQLVTLAMIHRQLEAMSHQSMIFDPVGYFIRGINKMLRMQAFKNQQESMQAESSTKLKVPMHNWLQEA